MVVLAGRRREALEAVSVAGSRLTGKLDAIPTDDLGDIHQRLRSQLKVVMERGVAWHRSLALHRDSPEGDSVTSGAPSISSPCE
jgi:hypothetical protein